MTEFNQNDLNELRDEYLEHFGVRGQKWGQRNYQNLDGSLTQAGREHYGVGKRLMKALKDHKVKKQRKAALDKARKAKEDKKKQQEKVEDYRRRAAKEPALMVAHPELFTTQELQDAANRANALSTLGSKTTTKTQKVIKTLANIDAAARTGYSIYDTVNKVNKAYKDELEKQTPAYKKQQEENKRRTQVSSDSTYYENLKKIEDNKKYLRNTYGYKFE